MALTISKKGLFDLLEKTFPIAPSKSSLQILSNIKITSQAGRLDLVATDLDHAARASCQVTGDDEFSIAINARKLFDIVREMPDGDVYVSIDGNVLILQSEKGFSCKIAGADPKDFPAFPDTSGGEECKVGCAEVKRMVARSSFAVSKETTRSCLCGVLWEVEKKKMDMVATDGHRLGSCVLKTHASVGSKVAAIISPKTLLHIVKITESESPDTTIKVVFGDKYIAFEINDFMICSKLIEGPYPDYDKVIPKTNPKKAIIDRLGLLDCVRRVSILSNQKTHLVKFTFAIDQLEIVVLNRDIGGEAREVVPISFEGDKHVIGFNGQYFSEILSIMDSAKVRMEMNTQISACMIYPVYDKDQKEAQQSEDMFLIMPLRIMEEG